MSLEDIINDIEKFITMLEAYEKPLYSDQLQAMITAVINLKAALEACQPDTGPLDAVIMGAPDVFKKTVQYSYAIERADNARLHLAAYIPHCARGSVTVTSLQQRRQVAQRLITAAKEARAAIAAQPRGRQGERSALWLVPSMGEGDQEREADEAQSEEGQS
jgi:hypothetical protein